MQRKDIAVIGIVVVLIAISVFLSVEGHVFGVNVGKIGGVVGVIANAIYCLWLIRRLTETDKPARERISSYLRPVPRDDNLPHGFSDLVDDQKELVSNLEREHRLFVAQFIGSMMIVPMICIWSFAFIFAVQPEFDRFLIELAMIGVPFFSFFVMIWIKGQTYRMYFGAMREYLDYTKKAVNTGQGDVDLTTYVNLMFSVIRPDVPLSEEEPAEQLKQVRQSIQILTYMPVVEIIVFASVFVTMSVLFITMGPVVQNNPIASALIISFYVIMAVTVIRCVIFLQWRKLVTRWLKIYSALVMWRQDLEQTFPQNRSTQERGV